MHVDPKHWYSSMCRDVEIFPSHPFIRTGYSSELTCPNTFWTDWHLHLIGFILLLLFWQIFFIIGVFCPCFAYRTFAIGVTSQQRMLTPLDTWSCPIWDLCLFWCWDHTFLDLSCFCTLTFQHPFALLFWLPILYTLWAKRQQFWSVHQIYYWACIQAYCHTVKVA